MTLKSKLVVRNNIYSLLFYNNLNDIYLIYNNFPYTLYVLLREYTF